MSRPQEPARPWLAYRKPDGSRVKLFEPGWAGELTHCEVDLLQQALITDPSLAYWWGFRPGMKRRAEAAIRRVAYYGDPECRSHNVKLAREAGRRLNADNKQSDSCVTKSVAPASAPLGRKRKESWESVAVRLAREGLSLRQIAERLQNLGVDISYRSVARRLAELRGEAR